MPFYLAIFSRLAFQYSMVVTRLSALVSEAHPLLDLATDPGLDPFAYHFGYSYSVLPSINHN